MGEQAPIVVDTNVLLNLATPVVDTRSIAPSGGDPFVAVLSSYEVHVPSSVLGEVSDTLRSDDLLAAAADIVMKGAHHLVPHTVDDTGDEFQEFGLDRGESQCIRLANEIEAEMFVTDEFNTTNYLLISLALDDRNSLFTTPHVLCVLATHQVLDDRYVDALLTYYIETKHWDVHYVNRLRDTYLAR